MLDSSPGRGRRQVLSLAWPLVLANASTPLLGLVDTAVMGRRGTVAELGAIALGALIFNFVYWTFGFLRMTTTGFVAQATGRGAGDEVRVVIMRAWLLGLGLGLLLVGASRGIIELALGLLSAGPEVETQTRVYFLARIWGAPAALVSLGGMGALIGLGKSKHFLGLQVLQNGLNIVLDWWFVAGLGWGVQGVAWGTALSQWMSVGVGIVVVVRVVRGRPGPSRPWMQLSRILEWKEVREAMAAHRDVMLRTILLLAGFAWFTDQGASFGDAVLAANHVLLQFIALSAFFLDGYAHVAESLVGQARGLGKLELFDRAVRRTSEVAVLTALVLASAVMLLGGAVVRVMTDLASVRTTALEYLPFAALYVALSAAAFQLDGVFIGTTRTRALRNAAFASLAVFLLASGLLVPGAGNTGLWIAFVIYVVARAVALAAALPALRRSIR